MEIQDFVRDIPGFSGKNHPEKIKCFGWFLHVHRGLERFQAADVRRLYKDAHIEEPANTNRFLDSLTEKQPKELLKDVKGYRLAQHVREALDAKLGKVETRIVVEKLLGDLPGKIADEGERVFLSEVLTCYKHGAFRAAIVMMWNLAYDHVRRWVLDDAARLAEFNAGIPKRNRSKAHVTIAKSEDFEDLKEDEVVDILGWVTGISGSVKRLLKEKLGRRNTFAHPSLLVVDRPQVDDMITDLVNNVILSLKLK